MMPPSIYEYIKQEENAFQTDEVTLGDNWAWNMRTHVQLIFHLKNGQFFTGSNAQTGFLRAFKNIMEPMLNLAYWTEDLEVKDVVFFIEGQEDRGLSFLIKKYHDEVFVREHNLDTLFDEITESDVDYGGVLVQKTSGGRPEMLHLNSLAFCDQTDILGAPLAFKHHFAPEKLRQMAKAGWGETSNGATISLEELIMLAGATKEADGTLDRAKNKVPGKTIEVYVVKGTLPEAYLDDSQNFEDHYGQVQVVAFYTDKNKAKNGVVLYRKKDDGTGLKFHTSQKVYGRALGRGTGEGLIPDQVFTNFYEIHKTKMLQAGAKAVLWTDDETFTNVNKVQEMEDLEVAKLQEGRQIGLIPTINPVNIQLYDKAINDWYEHGQLVGSAFDPILGKEQASGTTFKGQERTVAQGRGLHDRRRGQRAKFIEEIYREWIIPKIVKEITKGTEFLATLSLEEMNWVCEQMTTNHVNARIKKGMLEGKLMTKEEQDLAAQVFREGFLKEGNKKLMKILEGEFRGIEVRMGINIAGKQKDLVNLSDKLLSVFQYIFANPAAFQQAMQIPALAKSFTDILEFSGLNQADFTSLMSMPTQPLLPPGPEQQGQGQPQQQLMGAAEPVAA